ncbi:unnamed protein product [Didymodactylos carnosus]|uniref:Uncharacterized protein n=1 Tax=Didymodactylos carnosus TaxID=1234261 RepID=A0A814Y6X6_9BILA|nr:unnamed protein product [Didymodactylos carnosus]CAF3988280.1 unnamed protein product [Didymodactylos carnosus]
MASRTACANPDCHKGIGLFPCSGCQQTFCRKHSNEHYQALHEELDKIVLEHDSIKQQLQSRPMNCTQEIDRWEEESIRKIKAVAEEARMNLCRLINVRKEEMRTNFQVFTDEIGAKRTSGDFVEPDLDKWKQELEKVKHDIDSLENIKVNDHLSTTINMLEVSIMPALYYSHSGGERFDRVIGDIALSDNGRVATHTGDIFHPNASVYGANRYSSGTHCLSLYIEQMHWLFFGVISTSTSLKADAYKSSSAYGWVGDNAVPVKNVYLKGESGRGYGGYDNDMKQYDIIDIIFDCDEKRIRLVNKRTRKTYEIPIDLNSCPLPWRFVISFYWLGDRVRIW